MNRRTWIAAGAAAGATAIAIAAAVAFSEKREAVTEVGAHLKADDDHKKAKKRRTAERAVTHEIEEQVTRDSDTYRHDLYEVTTADEEGAGDVEKRTSVAHALLVEKDGYDLLDWIQSTKAGAGRELMTHLIESTAGGELAAFPTAPGGSNGKGGGHKLLTTAGFRPAPDDFPDRSKGGIWALDRCARHACVTLVSHLRHTPKAASGRWTGAR
eukprot:1195027-Prorocentrum_minimum.AAC.1